MHPTEEKYTSKEPPPGFSTSSVKQHERRVIFKKIYRREGVGSK